MILRNIRHIQRQGVEMVAADFTIGDGRHGCVELPASECGPYTETMLQRAAMSVEAAAQRDGYRAPGADRCSELH